MQFFPQQRMTLDRQLLRPRPDRSLDADQRRAVLAPAISECDLKDQRLRLSGRKEAPPNAQPHRRPAAAKERKQSMDHGIITHHPRSSLVEITRLGRNLESAPRREQVSISQARRGIREQQK